MWRVQCGASINLFYGQFESYQILYEMQKCTWRAVEEEKIDDFNMKSFSGLVDPSYTIRFFYIVHLLPITFSWNSINAFHFNFTTDLTIYVVNI